MLKFKSSPAYVTTDDGMIYYSILKLDSERMYMQDYKGSELDINRILQKNINEIEKQLSKIKLDLRKRENDLCSQRLF
jgi:hypothetical protein